MKIYCITNSINGKRYVGQSVRSIATRWRQHCLLSGRCRAIESAIKKYGADAFVIEELASAQSQGELDNLEKFWIARLNTVAPHGYNLSGGGDGAGVMHEETKALLRDISADTRAKRSAIMLGNTLGLGKFPSLEARAKMSAAKIGKEPSAETRARMSASKVGNTYCLGKAKSAVAIAKRTATRRANNGGAY